MLDANLFLYSLLSKMNPVLRDGHRPTIYDECDW
jgi:hypothetical protein